MVMKKHTSKQRETCNYMGMWFRKPLWDVMALQAAYLGIPVGSLARSWITMNCGQDNLDETVRKIIETVVSKYKTGYYLTTGTIDKDLKELCTKYKITEKTQKALLTAVHKAIAKEKGVI